jgi:uncharacterized protein YndB with AHSA1/START domain
MADILHRVGIRAPVGRIYESLTTTQGLSDWWTRDTHGRVEVGGVLQFRFGAGGFDMLITALETDAHVGWRVIDGPREWIDTRVDWAFRQEGEFTIVLFRHTGWQEPAEFMHHCSTKWAVFLMSLKSLVETGRGSPAPDDVKIDDWN